jgi:hypothetical protein
MPLHTLVVSCAEVCAGMRAGIDAEVKFLDVMEGCTRVNLARRKL